MPIQTGISGPPFVIPDLTPGTSYDVRIRAVNAAGASDWTDAQRITTLDEAPVTPPTGGRATQLNTSLMSGPYYTPIPSNPVLDPSSAQKSAIVAGIQKLAGLQWATTCFAVPEDPSYQPVYDLDPAVQSGQAHDWARGQSWAKGSAAEPVRIPDAPNFYPMPGNYSNGASWDGWGVVADPARGVGWAGWRMVKVGSTWQVATGHSFPIVGNIATVTSGIGRGDGLSIVAGSITVAEVEAAMADTTDSYVIPHALAASMPASLMDSSFRAPATKTDGTVTPSSSTVAQGSRFFLPASATTSSTNRFIRALTRTLKVHGIYIVDRNGSSPHALMVNFERFNPANPTDMVTQNSGNPSTLSNASSIAGAYYRAGLTFDYASLGAVPWGSLQLLRNWQGT